jgi:transcriptional regulator with XRE-family HTH domain
MIDITYLDALPLHPPPEDFESLSSYLMRIAEKNCYYERSILIKFMGVTMNGGHFGDYPHHFSEKLILRTACTESQLLATTFYYVGKKFGRSTQPHALARFFNGSVGKSLRYCPCCLGEVNYYSLTWRFLSLEGCPRHGCRIFDHCGHCGNSIPLFYLPPKVGVCPSCEKDLQSCSPDFLSEQEMYKVRQQIADIEYLSSPQDEEQNGNVARMVGARFRMFRKEKKYKMEDIAEHLSIPARSIKSLEHGTKDRSVYLQTYIHYAEYLDVPLQEILTAPLASRPKKEKRPPFQRSGIPLPQLKQVKRAQREDELVDQLQRSIEELRALDVPITVTALSRHMHMALPALRQYPAVKDLLQRISNASRDERRKQRSQREEEILEEVQKAIAYFNALGQTLSIRVISEYIHVPASQLDSFPRVKMLLRQVSRKKAVQKQWESVDEQVIIDQVQRAISELRASGCIPSQEAISSKVGMSLYRLQLYSSVNSILQQVADEGRLQRRVQSQLHSREMVKRVQLAREQLRVANLPVSRKAVAELVGLNINALQRYPEVKPLLAEIVEEYQQQGPERAQQREQELLEQIQQAMHSLEERGRRITQQAVGELIGYSDTGMLYYQEVRKLYRQVKDEVRQARQQQAQQREELLLEEIQNAVHKLREQSMPVTLKQIGRMVGMTVVALRKYSRIDRLFQQLMEERQEDRRKRAEQRSQRARKTVSDNG